MTDFFDRVTPVAKKDYTCENCQTFIYKGEKHAKYSGVKDNDFFHYRTHFDCEKMVIEWYKSRSYDEDDYYFLYEYVDQEPEMLEELFYKYSSVAQKFKIRRDKIRSRLNK